MAAAGLPGGDGERRSNSGHREEIPAKGDWTDELVSWYPLVAKPVPRKDLPKNNTAEAAVAKEWAKLRAADPTCADCC